MPVAPEPVPAPPVDSHQPVGQQEALLENPPSDQAAILETASNTEDRTASTSSSGHRSATREKQRPIESWHSICLWEILIAALSVSCMIAVAAILLAVQGHSLASWKLPISPNALISIFTTVSKSAALLVLAEGICQLKWIFFSQSSRRLKDFASFDEASRGPWGALLFISSVGPRAWTAALGALVIVLTLAMEPFVQQVLTYPTGMIPSGNVSATIGTTRSFDSGRTEGAVTTGQSSDLINAMALGIFTSDTQTGFSCPTGNCTWPAFQSLGVCSDCTDMGAMDVCPAGDSSAYMYMYSGTPGCLFRSYDPNPTNETLFVNATSAFSCSASTFANISIVYASDPVTTPWASRRAHKCVLSFCRKSYERTTFTGDVLKDTASQPKALIAGSTGSGPNRTGLCPFQVDGEANGDDETYWINGNDINIVGIALASLFWSSLNTNLGANNHVAAALSRRNGGDIPRTMDDVATSMTNQIRQGTNATQIHGTALIPVVHIKVSWPWLIYPAALVLAAVSFLIVTIVLSHKQRHIAWKSSTLATMYHSVHSQGTAGARLYISKSMRNAASESKALLSRDEDGGVALIYKD
ncbi:hypothetical protein HII31_10385 [Pseudocercospora fuligena]|uniref:Uncharacterized protein n=1 Tax=Pseudocercospora fuligena TaxID=685502 RepID=A0A8H6RBZ4_9PEZI|nr:hypothetical protein HII31_10385 [Pseudocercospora fuligena]